MKTVIVKTHDTSKTVNEAIIITQDGKPNVIKAGKKLFADKGLSGNFRQAGPQGQKVAYQVAAVD